MMGEPRVLELRIHGVANAPPAETLCTTTELIERKEGDEQGSFWRIRPAPSQRTPTRTLRRLAKRPGRVDLVTEAYSWGNQARSGGSAIALIGRAIVHVAWLLVLPFGLCNLAYWSRRDIKGADEEQTIWEGGDGARAIRVFALLQTLFYATGLLTVAVNIVALGCYRSDDRVCAALPGFMDGLASWNPVSRSAVLALVPVAVLLLIYLVGLRARGSFDPRESFDEDRRRERSEPDDRARATKRSSPETPPHPPLLSSEVFWQGTRSAQLSERTHLAAVLAFVLLVLATDAHMGTDGAKSILDMRPPADLTPENAVPFIAMVAGLLLLLGAVVLAIAGGGAPVDVRTKRAWATALLWVAAGAYIGWTLWAVLQRTAERSDDAVLVGTVVVPTALAAVGALIALSSLSWGYNRPVYRIVATALILVALGCVGLAELVFGEAEDPRKWLSWLALGLVALAVLVSYLPQWLEPRERERNRLLGWHGNGAATMLLTAWFSSLVLTGLVVLGAHAWLTTNADEPDTVGIWRLLPSDATTTAAAADSIRTPAFYERFAALLVVILVMLIVIVGVGVASALRRFPAFSLPTLRFPVGTPVWMRERDAALSGTRRLLPAAGDRRRSTRDSGDDGDDHGAVPRDRYPESEHVGVGRLRTVVQARRVAGLAHRGEPVLTALAALTAAALVFLGIPYLGEGLDGTADLTPGEQPTPSPAWESLVSVSGWALGLTALAAVAWVVTNALTSAERPLGLIWDIVSFFPRAGHPFSPPCYAERAVPEVKKRVMRFIDDEYADGNDPHVILSAHSMGATIAVAAIFALAAEDERGEPSPAGPRTRRVALLTHGVQLRAYFSRFFPEVFGWRVLGVRGTTGPSLFRSDPWSRQVLDEDAAPLVPLGAPDDPPSLVRHLGGDLRDPNDARTPRWRNLWRRTDYLGFPVFSYWGRVRGTDADPIDRGATERSPSTYLWTVARHSDYVSTLQYTAARDELVAMLTDSDRDDEDRGRDR